MKQLKLLFTVLFLAVLGLGNVWGEEVQIYLNEGSTGESSGITASGNVNTTASNGNPGNSFANTAAGNTTFTFSGFNVSEYSNLKLILDAKFSYPSTVTTYPYVTVKAYKNNVEVFSDATSIAVDSKVSGYQSYTVNITADFDKIELISTPGTGKSSKGNATTTYGLYMDNIQIKGTPMSGSPETTVSSIAVSGTAEELWKGDAFSHNGITVTATLEGGETEDVTSSATYSGYDMSVAGEQTVTVTYGEQTDTYNVNVRTIANTQETAYSVAEAIDLIEAGKDLATQVYVAGKVSQVVTPWSDQYNNVTYSISDDGETTSAQFQLFRCVTNDIAVGGDVVALGTLIKFNSTYEFAAGNSVVSYVAPAVERITGTITGTAKNKLETGSADDVYEITYNGDGELSVLSSDPTVATISLEGTTVTVHPVAAGSTTITISAPQTEGYTAATKTYTLTVSAGLSAAALPFAFDGGRNDVNPANGIKQTGLNATDYGTSPKLKFDGAGDEVVIRVAEAIKKVEYTIKGAPGTGAWSGQFDVLQSADGNTYTTLASHTSMATTATEMTSEKPAADTRYIKFVLTTKSNGNVALGSIHIYAASELDSPELAFGQASYTFFTDADDMEVTATSAAGSEGAITYALTAGDADAFLIDENTGYIVCETAGEYTVTATIAAAGAFAGQSVDVVVTISDPEDMGEAISIVFPYGETFYAMKKDLSVVEVLYADNKLYNIAEADKADLTWYKKETDSNVTFRNVEGKYIGIGSSNSIVLSESAVNWTFDSEKGYYYCGEATTRTFLLKDEATVKNYAVSNADNVGYSKKPVFATEFATAALNNISLSGTYTTEFSAGAEFEHEGLVVTANYEGGATKIVTSEATFSTPDMSAAGDQTVTVSFGGQEANYTITVSAPVPTISVDKETLAFGTININDVVEPKTVAVTLANLAEATLAITGDGAAKFAINVTSLTESGNVTVSASADEAGDFAATLTISGEGAESKEIVLSMTVVVPDNCDGSDDFETATSTSASSYNSRTTTDGWSATNAALTTIGDEKFLTINGKTSAVGVITSPEIAGLQSLKIRYANTMSESNGAKFRVDVKVGDDVVFTETVTRANEDMTQNEIYTAEFSDMKVQGDCQIVITNLSPSNSNSNKDRLSIGRICYTTYNIESVRPITSSSNIGTICLEKEVVEFSGATFYEIAYKEMVGEYPYKIFFDQVDHLEAGKAYIFEPEAGATEIKVVYGANEVANPVAAADNNGLQGTFTGINTDGSEPEALTGKYLVSQNRIRLCGNNCSLADHRAYIVMDKVPDPETAAPVAARRISLGTQAADMATDLESLSGEENATKIMVDGVLFILRHGQMYDSTGRLVK